MLEKQYNKIKCKKRALFGDWGSANKYMLQRWHLIVMFSLLALYCRTTGWAGLMCFCEFGTCDTRPVNGSQCTGNTALLINSSFLEFLKVNNKLLLYFQQANFSHPTQ